MRREHTALYVGGVARAISSEAAVIDCDGQQGSTGTGCATVTLHGATVPRLPCGPVRRIAAILMRGSCIVTLGFAGVIWGRGPTAQELGSIRNCAGLQLLVAAENAQPTLRIVLPGRATSDRAIEVLFPEHVTAVRQGSTAVEHLYLFQPGASGERPVWRRIGQALEYERDLRGAVHIVARATLDNDGVRFHYRFSNHSTIAYDMIYAVTDPRLTSLFHDPRLERTYVHHADGFDLLASETPARLTMPLAQWLPARYLASFTWPVPEHRVQQPGDGFTYYYKSRAVDEPFIATLSTDSTWVVASFTRETGNVWSNPELTCQHVDPQTALAPGQQAILELKVLVLQESLDATFRRMVEQRGSLR